MNTHRYVHLDVNGTPIRMTSDPLTAIFIYILTFCFFTALDFIIDHFRKNKP